MNWEAIGAVGEILSAIAVIATLGYLATQIHQSRKATIAEVYQSRALARGAATLQVALNSPDFHKIIFRFEKNLKTMSPTEAVAELSEEEEYLVRMYYNDLMVRMDNVYFQYQQGFLSEEYFQTAERGLMIFVPVWKALGIDEQFPITSAEFFEAASKEKLNDV
jgi:hypothetical protein